MRNCDLQFDKCTWASKYKLKIVKLQIYGTCIYISRLALECGTSRQKDIFLVDGLELQ